MRERERERDREIERNLLNIYMYFKGYYNQGFKGTRIPVYPHSSHKQLNTVQDDLQMGSDNFKD